MTSPAAAAATCVVEVRLFAGLRERAGWGQRLVAISAEGIATPLTVWQQLQLDQVWRAAHAAAAAPAGKPQTAGSGAHAQGATGGGEPAVTGRADEAHGKALPPGVRVAINQAFAAADTRLGDGDELAFLPPISGG